MQITSFTLEKVVRESVSYLESKDIDCPRLSADLLVGHVLGFSKIELILYPKHELDVQQILQLKGLLRRRGQGEPIAYILGRKEFFGLDLDVAPQVLIPRPETEEIIEQVKTLFAPEERFIFADIGTGSGAIAAALLHVFPFSKGLLLDISLSALKLAFYNARKYSQLDRYQLVQADQALSLKTRQFDLVVSNPPYLMQSDFDELSPEISGYEPRIALIAGQSRADMHIAIARQAYRSLKPQGWLIMEIDCRQKGLEKELFAKLPRCWGVSFLHKDLAGLERLIAAQKAV